MKRAGFVSSLFYPLKRKKRASTLAEEIETAPSQRFTNCLAPIGLEDVPREIWAYIFSMADVPNREYISLQLVSKWFYNTYWDNMSAFVFNREGSTMVHRALMTCRRESVFCLELFFCPTAGINKYLSRMRNLKKLVIRTEQSKLRGPGFGNLLKLPSITILDLNCLGFSENQTNPKLEIITQLSQLKSLSLSGCAIVDNTGLELLCRLSNLSVLNLDLSRGFFTDQGLAALQSLKKLKSLSLSLFTSSSRVTDVGMNYIAALWHLETLHLSHCTLSDFGVDLLGQSLTQLKELSLTDCSNVTGSGLHRFKTLTLLDLGGTAFHDGTVSFILDNAELKFLDLSSCAGLSDEGLVQIASAFPFLLSLSLAHCRKIRMDKRSITKKFKCLVDLVLPCYQNMATSPIEKLFRSKLRGDEHVIAPWGEAFITNYDISTEDWFYNVLNEMNEAKREAARLAAEPAPVLRPSVLGKKSKVELDEKAEGRTSPVQALVKSSNQVKKAKIEIDEKGEGRISSKEENMALEMEVEGEKDGERRRPLNNVHEIAGLTKPRIRGRLKSDDVV